eukprot:m.251651 g.251651  ORF g.251651 m.251651 type:complete len:92 (+) comp33900_c1_seq1:179-454(+)
MALEGRALGIKLRRDALRISVGWVGVIFLGVGAFAYAKQDIDKQRLEKMKTEGPLYRVHQPKEGVTFENFEQLEATIKSVKEVQRLAKENK